MEGFGRRLKELRQTAKITQSDLADKLNLHPQTVSKWERGLSEPDIAQLGELAAALGISLEKLLGREEAEISYVGTFRAEAFGKMLSELRAGRGESQEALAAAALTSPDAVSRWERGITCPDIERLSALAEHFEVPVSKLYCGYSEAPAAESVAFIKKRKRISAVSIAAAAILLLAGILAFALLWQIRAPNLYTVTLDGNEVSVSENDWFTPQTPARDGYDFIGWEDERGGAVSFPCKITEDCTYTAVFAPHEYTIDYWLNGGYFLQTPQNTFTVESGLLEIPLPEKNGAVFEGWYTAADYSGEPITQIQCAGENVQLFAKWSDAVYTVRYELNGGVLHGEENPESVTSAGGYELKAPVRQGYIFLGWYDQPNGGERYESVGGDSAKNITLYALWQKCDDLFTVYYDLNGGEPNAENPVSVGAGEVHKLNGASRTGYTFLGWNTEKDGSGEYVEYLYGVDETLYLYAVFEPKAYVIRYIFEGAYEGEETNPNTVVYGESVTLLPVELYGHEFIGWYDAKEGGNKIGVIDAANILTVTTLYARFEPLEFKLKLNACGGTFVSDGADRTEHTLTIRFGETITLPDCSLTGHDFLGWNESPDGSGEFYKSFTGMEGDQSLYAVYAPKEYLIRYEYDGVFENGKVNPNYVTYGETVVLHPVYRPGYEFVGWFDAKEGGEQFTVLDKSNISEIAWLYARYKPLQFEITLDACGGSFIAPDGAKTVYTYILEYGQTFELPLCTREGYAFLGWLDESGNEIAEITPANMRDMTLTADWLQTGVEYRIEYIPGGGAMEEPNPDTALSDVSAPLPEPVREGYLFLGWYDNPAGAGEPYVCTPFGRTDDLTLYALWQEIKVSGSAEFFDYEKTSSEVTITAYTGSTGENVDVVIPSVIDGLPVTQIGSNTVAQHGANMVRYSIFGAPDSAQIRSLTIPEGVLILKENAFRTLKVSEPLQLPSTLERIEGGCFEYYGGDIGFSDEGNLTYIGRYAFHGVRFIGTLVVPRGVKTIDGGAFYGVKTCGVILPDTVETIFDSAFYQPNGYIDRIYIPASVTYIGFRALSGSVYTELSEEQAKMFDPAWGVAAAYNVQKSAVTLIDGETRQQLYGEAFALPSPQKDGYTFLGWQDESGEFVGDCYIPNRNAALVAVYEKQSESDGRTLSSAAVLDTDTTYEFTLLDGQVFYFRPDVSQTCRILISVNGDFRWNVYRVRENAAEHAGQNGSPVDFRAGDVYYVETDPVPTGTAMTIRIILLAS